MFSSKKTWTVQWNRSFIVWYISSLIMEKKNVTEFTQPFLMIIYCRKYIIKSCKSKSAISLNADSMKRKKKEWKMLSNNGKIAWYILTVNEIHYIKSYKDES